MPPLIGWLKARNKLVLLVSSFLQPFLSLCGMQASLSLPGIRPLRSLFPKWKNKICPCCESLFIECLLHSLNGVGVFLAVWYSSTLQVSICLQSPLESLKGKMQDGSVGINACYINKPDPGTTKWLPKVTLWPQYVRASTQLTHTILNKN